jgi:drug/metabolite transporter (DMT)-like permease
MQTRPPTLVVLEIFSYMLRKQDVASVSAMTLAIATGTFLHSFLVGLVVWFFSLFLTLALLSAALLKLSPSRYRPTPPRSWQDSVSRSKVPRNRPLVAAVLCVIFIFCATFFVIFSTREPRYASASMTASSPLESERQMYRVINVPRGGEVTIRTEPAASSSVVAKLHPGDHVYSENSRMHDGTTTWQEVTSFSGYTGWVNADYLSLEK